MSLTHREGQVIRLLWDGLESRAIGEELGISGGCVRKYQMRTARKLGVPNRLGRVMERALKEGVIQP